VEVEWIGRKINSISFVILASFLAFSFSLKFAILADEIGSFEDCGPWSRLANSNDPFVCEHPGQARRPTFGFVTWTIHKKHMKPKGESINGKGVVQTSELLPMDHSDGSHR